MKTKSNSPVELRDRLEAGPEVHGDAVGVRAAGDIAPSHLRALLVDLARVDATVGRKTFRHGQRGVAAVRADLEHATSTEAVDEKLEEPSLDSAGHHLRIGERRLRLGLELDE